MTPAMIGILAFIAMIVLILLRFPVYLSMAICSLVGMMLIVSPSMVDTQFTTAPFITAASYSFALLPLFGFMGVLTEASGIAEGTFQSANAWLGNTRGGLLSSVIVANTVFGACSGTATSGSIIFSRMAMPSLDKYGYERSNALACICTSSALASLIPPSAAILVTCMLCELSIARGLMCGVGAGLLTTILLLLYVQIISRLPNSKMVPSATGEKVPMKEKIKSLRLLIPVVALFCIIIIGAATGFFSATVGGAVGSFAVVIYALVKRIPLRKIFKAAVDAIEINSNVFPLMLAGTLFGRLITLTKLPDVAIDWISSIHAPMIVIFTVVVIFYIICGCVMDIMSCIFITVPIIFPIMTSLGFDGYAMMICLVILINLGGITPPIGMGCFITANAVNVNPAVIFKGIWPYCIITVITAYIVAFFPQIISFLPDLIM